VAVFYVCHTKCYQYVFKTALLNYWRRIFTARDLP